MLRRQGTPAAIQKQAALAAVDVARARPRTLQVVSVDALNKSLYTHIPSREQYRTTFGASLTLERIAAAIESANQGAMRDLTDLSRETIDVDPHLSAILNKRFGATAAFPYEVVAASGEGIDEAKARFFAEVVRAQVEAIPNFSSRVRDLAWGLFDGRAAAENLWGSVPRPQTSPFGKVSWAIRDLGWIHPRRLSFGPQRELRIVDAFSFTGFTETGVALRDIAGGYKFIEFTPRLFGDYPEREGLARRCLYWSFFKRFGAKERMVLLELFSKPWRWLEHKDGYEGSIGDDEKDQAEDFIEGIAGDGYGQLPAGVEMKTASPPHQSGTIHGEVIDTADKQNSKLVLGQTGTTDAQPLGLNSGLALVLSNEQFMIAQADSAMLSEAFQEGLVNSIIALNFGIDALDHAPEFRIRADVRDRKSELERLQLALNSGLAIKRSEAYEIAGFEEPTADDPVIQVATPPTSAAGFPEPARPMLIYPPGKAPAPQELAPAPEDPTEEEEPTAAPSGPGAAPPPDPTPPGGDVPPMGTDTEEEPEPEVPPRGGTRLPGMAATRAQGGAPRLVTATAGAITEAGAKRLLATLGDGRELDTVVRALRAPITSERRPAAARYPESVCCARQPETTFGSPEVLISKGVREAARQTGRLADELIEAGARGSSFADAYRRIAQASVGADISGLARATERRIAHGAMLGALDSAFEREHDTLIEIESFGGRRGDVRLVDPDAIKPKPRFAEMPFTEAAKFFRAKRILRKEDFEVLTAGAKRRAFTVARLSNQRLLEAIHGKLGNMIAEGADFREFKRFMTQEIESAGWVPANPSHVETIFRTNVVQSYSVGRIKDMTNPTVLRARPFWQIRAVGDARSREPHKAVNGWVLRAEDSFFERAFPGNFGFNCRCRAVSLSEKQVAARGHVIRSGSEIRHLPDPGFSGAGMSALLRDFS